MTIKFDKKEENYLKIQSAINKKKEAGKRSVLNVHIPGTGCKWDAELPTFSALQAVIAATENDSIPAIFFDGAGSDVDLPTVQRSAHTLNKKTDNRNIESTIPFSGVLGLSQTISGVSKNVVQISGGVSNLDDIAQISKGTAKLAGIVAGAGKDVNTATIINTLLALEEDDALPDEIFLSGHSRGAINCIDLANKIYQKFGNKIKVHLCLTDPVPGPGHWHDVEEKVIPPNVATFTTFYAEDEKGIFFTANDMSRLVFMNPKTTVTSYSLKDTNHGTVVGDNPARDAIRQLTFAMNGVDYVADKRTYKELYGEECGKNWWGEAKVKELYGENYLENYRYKNFIDQQVYKTRLKGQEKRKPTEMVGKSAARIDEVFYKTTSINPSLTKEVKVVIDTIRDKFELGYKSDNQQDNEGNKETIELGSLTEKSIEQDKKTAETISIEEFKKTAKYKINPDYFNNVWELNRKKEIYDAYRYEMDDKCHVSYGELIAFLLILPTFGLSANAYQSNQKMTSSEQIWEFVTNLLVLNLTAIFQQSADTGGKLISNMGNGGFFRPASSRCAVEVNKEKDLSDINSDYTLLDTEDLSQFVVRDGGEDDSSKLKK